MSSAVTIPWSAWHGDTSHKLELPAHWTVDVLNPPHRSVLTPEQIATALDHPIGSRSLTETARGQRTACVVVDDLARPTPASLILPRLIAQLQAAGITDDEISIVIATGTHGSLQPQEIQWKVGKAIASRFHVECHCSRGDLVGTGIKFGNDELFVNRRFHEADVKLGVGSTMPHAFAAFSGGAKLLLPGLSDVKSAARSHKFVLMGLRGGTDPDSNRFRLESEEIARRLGFEYVVSVVTDGRRNIVGLFAGDIVAAHRKACEFSRDASATIVSKTYNCLVLNAYPKDTDLIQATNSLIPLKTLRQPILHDSGLAVITTAASAGIGIHGLFAPGGLSYRPPKPLRVLSGRDLWIYAPRLPQSAIHQVFWSGYRCFQNGERLSSALEKRFGSRTVAAVVPAAPLQQLRNSPAWPDY